MIRGIIYKYTSPSGKVYIGQTINEDKRKYAHRNDAYNGSNLPFHTAIRKYGWENFDYNILFETSSKDYKKIKTILNALEQFFIRRYKSNNPIYGYNCNEGGQMGTIISDKTKKKMSISHIGINGKRVYQYDYNGKLINSFHSLSEAEDITGVLKTSICDVCNNKLNSAGGYYWSYILLEDSSILFTNNMRGGKWCYQYTIDGIFIKKYPTVREAARVNNYDNSAISKVCRGKQKTYKGFIWSYNELK